MAQSLEVCTRQGFGQYVGRIILRSNSLNGQVTREDEFAGVVILHSNVLRMGMPNVVF